MCASIVILFCASIYIQDTSNAVIEFFSIAFVAVVTYSFISMWIYTFVDLMKKRHKCLAILTKILRIACAYNERPGESTSSTTYNVTSPTKGKSVSRDGISSRRKSRKKIKSKTEDEESPSNPIRRKKTKSRRNKKLAKTK